jgi:hypothetical protein
MPPSAPPPRREAGAGDQSADHAARHVDNSSGVRHNPATCATCRPDGRPTLGSVLRERAKSGARPTLGALTRREPAPVEFIGTPARQVAGEILSGEKPVREIARELVDVLGPVTARMLSDELYHWADDL